MKAKRMFRRIALGMLLLVMLGGQAPADAPVIAAASDLQFALEEIAEAFEAETSEAVTLTFSSSGNLARQIRQGAPYELYLAADERFVLDLNRDGFTRDEGVVYALGRLAIFAPDGSPLTPDGNLDGLAAALAAGRITRFAIANPDHAPYGRRAEEALRHRGLWDRIAPKLVLGENVSQAAQFAVTGNAQGGIIAHSLALAPEVARRGSFALIPESWHTPLTQRMALLKRAGAVAEHFYRYLQSPPGQAILRRHGFALPEGDG